MGIHIERLLNPWGRRQFYLNDVVCQKSIDGNSVQFGRVGKPLEYKDWADVRKGFEKDFWIHWKKGQEEFDEAWNDPEKVQIVDREIKLGTIVYKDANCGKVIQTAKVAYVKPERGPNDKVLWEVNADNLFPIERAFPGRHVLLKNWIGIIEKVERDILVQTESGHIAWIPIELRGNSPDYFWDDGIPLQGSKVKLRIAQAYKANWIDETSTAWFINLASSFLGLLETSVIDIRVSCMTIQWMGLRHQKFTPLKHPMPPSTLTNVALSKLEFIDFHPSDFLKKGSLRLYKQKIEDIVIPSDSLDMKMLAAKQYESTARSEAKDKISVNGATPVKVLFIRNIMTVLWKDGYTSSVYASEIDKLGVTPGTGKFLSCPSFVVYKTVLNEEDEGYGFVKSYDFNARIYHVDWYKDTNNQIANTPPEARDIPEFDAEEHFLFQRLAKKGQIVIKSLDSKLSYFEVGVVTGVYNGEILVCGSDGERSSISPTDLAPFNRISTWDSENSRWVIEERPEILVRKVSSVALTRRDSAKELLCESGESENQDVDSIGFRYLPNAPTTHHFYSESKETTIGSEFARLGRAIHKEVNILRGCLPSGIYVRGYEDRMDLFSVLIEGPDQTPYEAHFFLFDVKIPQDYPEVPPLFHYISWSDKLNPNLYTNGKVCLSLLGTWEGKEEEKWTSASTLLQVLVSIQGLILVPEPFFNEPGFAHLRGTEEGKRKSAEFNQTVTLLLLDACFDIIARPPKPWRNMIAKHYFNSIPKINRRLDPIVRASLGPYKVTMPKSFRPEYPLLPLQKSYAIAMQQRLERLDELMALVNNALDSGLNFPCCVQTQGLITRLNHIKS